MKTLILFATKYGCTEKAAYLLKSHLGGEVEVVNLKLVKEPVLAAYDNVILGGSVYYGKIRKEMASYTHKYEGELKSKRLGLFICAGAKGEQAELELKQAFPEELYSRALVKAVFGDEINPKMMSTADKLILRMVKGKVNESSGLSHETIERFAAAMN